MDEVQSTYSAELAIQRALEATGNTGSGGLKYRTATIEVVDAAYLTPAEADAYDPEHAAYLRGLADGRAGTMTIEEKRRLAAMLGAATREARAAVESEFGTAKADEVVARSGIARSRCRVPEQPWCPRCGDARMLGGEAPGATYWVCPKCRRDLRVGAEAEYLADPLPHRPWVPGDQSGWRDRLYSGEEGG